ncbi:MAG TPA: class I SAM-dependent methyltransferase [Candidatus Binataceae bacterium]|nr:class I SAM-dependent methyltransferase [Candidatus Binataceae bacterium]
MATAGPLRNQSLLSFPASVAQLMNRFYPAYPCHAKNGTRAFYGWIGRYINAHSVVLNLGAGAAAREPERNLRGQAAVVIGADIDPVVLDNHQLDQAYVIQADQPLPFDSASFDLVLSDFVLEHLAHPLFYLREAARVLKPGGNFFFRTPNRYHYVGLIARLSGQRVHRLIANRVRCLTDAPEPWPTFYRANSRHQLRDLAKAAGFGALELQMWEGEPSYLVFSPVAFRLGVAYERLVTHWVPALRANLLGRCVR